MLLTMLLTPDLHQCLLALQRCLLQGTSCCDRETPTASGTLCLRKDYSWSQHKRLLDVGGESSLTCLRLLADTHSESSDAADCIRCLSA